MFAFSSNVYIVVTIDSENRRRFSTPCFSSLRDEERQPIQTLFIYYYYFINALGSVDLIILLLLLLTVLLSW